MGLVQLFRDLPCPDVMARELLNRVLADFRETGHHYLLELVHAREKARQGCTAEKLEEVKALDAQIHEHAIFERMPQRWKLDFLFSRDAYVAYGDGLLAVWASVLIEICVLEQHWEGALLGLPPRNPYLLPGFHPDKDVLDTAWLQEARRTWLEEIHAETADAAEMDEPKEELHDGVYFETEPGAAKRGGSWLH